MKLDYDIWADELKNGPAKFPVGATIAVVVMLAFTIGVIRLLLF